MSLFSLFVIACGLVFLETAANPYMTELGDRETAASRLNLAQSFNGLGCACAPLLVGMMLFSEGQEANLSFPYMMMGIVVLVVALIFSRVQLPEITHAEDTVQTETTASKKGVWSNKLFVFGISALFCYEIAEISINSFFINYVVDDGWMNALDAAKLLSVAGLGLFMCGRFLGSWIMRFVRAEKFLLICAIGTVLATAMVVMNLGMVSFVSLILIYLMVLGGLGHGIEVVVDHPLSVVVLTARDDVAHVAALHGVVAILLHELVGLVHVALVVAHR